MVPGPHTVGATGHGLPKTHWRKPPQFALPSGMISVAVTFSNPSAPAAHWHAPPDPAGVGAGGVGAGGVGTSGGVNSLCSSSNDGEDVGKNTGNIVGENTGEDGNIVGENTGEDVGGGVVCAAVIPARTGRARAQRRRYMVETGGRVWRRRSASDATCGLRLLWFAYSAM